ncbi:MAG: Heavy metal translocating P-type ATPase [Candidatus Collierbacteria bacterium GW2011_GWB1_44_6]|uniref:Heavy metal translocating P-type ATPase n=2 Tax=Candidatus Collieribacteriota TaxID=1752725 RepID=A0A0G1JMC7_9BACT|nr:MAG: Heavy metal translocating P-type ATPase [Candidatus Collierbacteria bacterium GW2011_GWC2_43_12]KKT72540.1 MAG: Heavy metal translocating P-type ATPase [Candidatus Collierbacteria bacterium GW2011_GWB1_44_6]
MFNFLKPKSSPKSDIQKLESEILKLSGLHCTSCAVNIDLALEDLPSVKAKTNYAKSETKIEYNPGKVTLDEIHFVIRDLGYSIE